MASGINKKNLELNEKGIFSEFKDLPNIFQRVIDNEGLKKSYQ